MRQIGDDLRIDPHAPIVHEAVPAADLNNPANASAFAQFTWNKFAEMSHSFCTSGLDFKAGGMSDAESKRFQTCLSKYSETFKIFQQEQGAHYAALAAIEKAGGDKFAKFNEYDRY